MPRKLYLNSGSSSTTNRSPSVIQDNSEFNPPTLTSALRIATIYNYPALRTFAIRRLERASLSAIDRIRLAREFRLPSWEEPAYVELREWDEAITTSEASVLGLKTFVQLARIREQEQRRRGRDIDAMMDDGGDNESLSEDSHILEAGLKTTESVALPASDLLSYNLHRRSGGDDRQKGLGKQTENRANCMQVRTKRTKVRRTKRQAVSSSLLLLFRH